MEEVALRPITLSDTDNIVRWRNSDAVRLNMCDQGLLTAEQHRNYFHEFIETKRIAQYIIEVGKKPIGTIFQKLIDKDQAEIGLFIGEDNYRGKGYGTQALDILLSIFLKECKQKLYLKVRKTNIPALKMYRKLGFELLSEDGYIVEMIKISENEI